MLHYEPALEPNAFLIIIHTSKLKNWPSNYGSQYSCMSMCVLAHKAHFKLWMNFSPTMGIYGFPGLNDSCQYRSIIVQFSFDCLYFQKWQKLIWAPWRLASFLKVLLGSFEENLMLTSIDFHFRPMFWSYEIFSLLSC